MRLWPIPVLTIASLCLLGCMGAWVDSPLLLILCGTAIAVGFFVGLYRTL